MQEREVLREAICLLESSGMQADEEKLRDINYRLRKLAEEVIVSLGRDSLHTHRVVSVYIRLGDNYNLLCVNPSRAIENIITAVQELKSVLELTEGGSWSKETQRL